MPSSRPTKPGNVDVAIQPAARSSSQLNTPSSSQTALQANPAGTSTPASNAAARASTAELKRRIAQIEMLRNAKRQRTEKQPPSANSSSSKLPVSTPRSVTLATRPRYYGESNTKPRPVPDALAHARTTAPISRTESPRNSNATVILTSGVSTGPAASTEIVPSSNPVDSNPGLSPAAWNARCEGSGQPATLHIPNSADVGHINDLKTQLELKNRQLSDMQECSDMMQTANASVVEASAKLSFLQSREAQLRKDLDSTREEIAKAEAELQRMIAVAREMRVSFGGLAADMPMPVVDLPSPARVVRAVAGGARDGSSDLLDSVALCGATDGMKPNSSSGAGTMVSSAAAKRAGRDLRREEGRTVDVVARPSCFTPSTGEEYMSVLTGIRAYASAGTSKHQELKSQVGDGCSGVFLSFEMTDCCEFRAMRVFVCVLASCSTWEYARVGILCFVIYFCFVFFFRVVFGRGYRYLLRIPQHSGRTDRRTSQALSLTWTLKVDPNKFVCPRGLRGLCFDKECTMQHLSQRKTRVEHAIHVIEFLGRTVPADRKRNAEKDVVRAKLAIRSGKNVDITVSTLISSLWPAGSRPPFSLPHQLER